jgi:predicted phage baseplate assembly protein
MSHTVSNAAGTDTGVDANCPCDVFIHPQPLAIDAGLSVIPRQIAGFPEYRKAMLQAIPSHPALARWRARSEQDLGMMLLEMWAYVCDVVSFYDELIAQESYLRTARRDPNVRKLVGLLGYLPRPAVAAQVRLAINAQGRTPLVLPAGLAVRSTAFGDQAPQVFELDTDTAVHPLLNGWKLTPTRPTVVQNGTHFLLSPETAKVKPGDLLLLLRGAGQGEVVLALDVTKIVGRDNQTYVRIAKATNLVSPVTLAGTRLLRSSATTQLWTNQVDPATLAPSTTTLHLSGVVPNIRPSLKVNAVTLGTRKVSSGSTFTTQGTTVTTPDVRVPNTVLTINNPWPVVLGSDPAAVTINYDFQDAGTITAEHDDRIATTAQLLLARPVEVPPDGSQAGRFIVSDVNGSAAEIAGGVNFSTRVLTPAQGSGLTAPLHPPATVYANIANFSRGETVPMESLGVGDASVANQHFTLKKKPLTYLSGTGSGANGAISTATVWVGEMQWHETPSFFGVGSHEEVFIVRQNDNEESTITFGDGVRGSRLPTGATVVARYRFGAGASSPPAGALTQLAKPVKGVASILNPIGSAGGADRQPASQVRQFAPRSVLLFGRAVSITDIEALAGMQPGVQAVQARWAWDATMQQPAIKIRYIGAASIAIAIVESLRAATAPATPIVVTPATPIPATLTVGVRVHPRYRHAQVQHDIVRILTSPGIGPIAPDLIGVGTALYRSQLLETILATSGVTSVESLLWNGTLFHDYAIKAPDGSWFQIALTVHTLTDEHVGLGTANTASPSALLSGNRRLSATATTASRTVRSHD